MQSNPLVFTLVGGWVGQSLMFSDVWNCYRIFQAQGYKEKSRFGGFVSVRIWVILDLRSCILRTIPSKNQKRKENVWKVMETVFTCCRLLCYYHYILVFWFPLYYNTCMQRLGVKILLQRFNSSSLANDIWSYLKLKNLIWHLVQSEDLVWSAYIW